MKPTTQGLPARRAASARRWPAPRVGGRGLFDEHRQAARQRRRAKCDVLRRADRHADRVQARMRQQRGRVGVARGNAVAIGDQRQARRIAVARCL